MNAGVPPESRVQTTSTTIGTGGTHRPKDRMPRIPYALIADVAGSLSSRLANGWWASRPVSSESTTQLNTNPSRSDVPGFSAGLASLRGIAAAVVVIFHALLIFRVDGIDDPHRLPLEIDSGWLLLKHSLLAIFNGPAAVVLFFVLSGTVLSLSMARSERYGFPELTAFYVRRFFRLVPLLFAVALVAAVMHYVYFTGEQVDSATSWMNRYYQHEPGPKEIVANAIGWSNSLNSPAWTIFIEIVASLVFPALYVLSMRTHMAGAALVLLLVAMFAPLPLRHVDVFLICFFVGALVPRLGRPLADAFYRRRIWLRTALLIAALTTMGWFERLYSPEFFSHPTTILVVTLCAAFLVTVVYFSPGSRFLRWQPFVFLGEISYGLYLIHFVVLYAIVHAIAPTLHGALTPNEAILLNLGLGIATLAVTIPIAALAYYALERPCQRFGRTTAGIVTEAAHMIRSTRTRAP